MLFVKKNDNESDNDELKRRQVPALRLLGCPYKPVRTWDIDGGLTEGDDESKY
jgi:hypothetical protein